MVTRYGTAAADNITGTNETDAIFTLAGNDTVHAGGGFDFMDGGLGDDWLYGGLDADQILGGAGNDRLFGEAGADVLRGDDGADKLYGGSGDDLAFGGAGNDQLQGGPGNDLLDGGLGNDILTGNAGVNRLFGGGGNDLMIVDQGSASIRTDEFGETLYDGGTGTDTLRIVQQTKPANPEVNIRFESEFGGHISYLSPQSTTEYSTGVFRDVEKFEMAAGSGPLYLDGHLAQSFEVTGSQFNDSFVLGQFRSVVRGGAGDDRFSDEGGNDTLISDPNDNDRFVYGGDSKTAGFDTITGFNGAGQAGGDVIELNGPTVGLLEVFEVKGQTWFYHDDSDQSIIVDAVGLKEDVDYFFI
jgi:Ca2+-binding RTX toxin-like protein